MSDRIATHLRRLSAPVTAVLLGLMAGLALVTVAGGTAHDAFRVMWNTSVACTAATCGFFQTLGTATPLILTTMAAVICFRSGLFSIGQEGQYVVGALAATYVGYSAELPAIVHVTASLVAGVVAGGLYGLVPGLLRAYLNVNELIATIIFNNIALMLAAYLVNYPMRADRSSQAYTPAVHDSAHLPAFVPSANLGVGLVIAVATVVATRWFLFRTTAGFGQRMAGQAPIFARYAGIPARTAAVRAMTISGGVAGLAGGVQVLGVTHRFIDGFGDGTGLDGITAAILANFAPVGAALVAVLISALSVGSLGLQIDLGIPAELGGTVTALLILVVASQGVLERMRVAVARTLRRPGRGSGPETERGPEKDPPVRGGVGPEASPGGPPGHGAVPVGAAAGGSHPTRTTVTAPPAAHPKDAPDA